MLERQIHLARRIANLLLTDLSKNFELLPTDTANTTLQLQQIYVIVLWRLKDKELNEKLPAFTQLLNADRRIYVSGTKYEGKPAARFAIANWQVDVERDVDIIRAALVDVLEASKKGLESA
jgi:hypothetical protein